MSSFKHIIHIPKQTSKAIHRKDKWIAFSINIEMVLRLTYQTRQWTKNAFAR
ncbi:hypothetical protein GCM10011391_39890 [Pullulanibacillus camelliae]|uniref:Uncharacterized protein n=1 Tax=Pullulanibacillus camelliae TaxID=1707096 RepID=A0A8J2YNZ6_9BACL|nr:hypothetical protein GCM10011391_39890 [Pullulanibacillus camelliae]